MAYEEWAKYLQWREKRLGGALVQRTKYGEDEVRVSTRELLVHLGDEGFAWRDVAAVVRASVAEVQAWRRGTVPSRAYHNRLADLLGTVTYLRKASVFEPVAWLETPLLVDVPIRPLDFLLEGRMDLVLAAAADISPEVLFDDLDPEWRENTRSDYEVFVAADGVPSIRKKAGVSAAEIEAALQEAMTRPIPDNYVPGMER